MAAAGEESGGGATAGAAADDGRRHDVSREVGTTIPAGRSGFCGDLPLGDVQPADIVQLDGHRRPEELLDVRRLFVRVVGVEQVDVRL